MTSDEHVAYWEINICCRKLRWSHLLSWHNLIYPDIINKIWYMPTMDYYLYLRSSTPDLHRKNNNWSQTHNNELKVVVWNRMSCCKYETMRSMNNIIYLSSKLRITALYIISERAFTKHSIMTMNKRWLWLEICNKREIERKLVIEIKNSV